MDSSSALGYLRKIKILGFREEELKLPILEKHTYTHEIPSEENFGEFLEFKMDSFYQSLLFSDFPYSIKGCFAFSLIADEIKKIGKIGNIENKEEKTGISCMVLEKTKNTKWAEKIKMLKSKKLNESEIKKFFDSIPSKAYTNCLLETRFIVYGDRKDVHGYIKITKEWRKMFSMPFKKAVWHDIEEEFIAAYALKENVYGVKEFAPLLGSLVFAATPTTEYSWKRKTVAIGLVETVWNSLENLYGTKNISYLKDFIVLSLGLKNAVFAEKNGKRMYAPEFFVNMEYLLAKAEIEKTNNNFEEALFFLRTAAELSFLGLRNAPFEGKMLALLKFFDENENVLSHRFRIESNLAKVLNIENRKNARFGDLFSLIYTPSAATSQSLIKIDEKYRIFWKKLGCFNAILFLVKTENKDKGRACISFLEEESVVPRGSDIFKVEEKDSRIIVKRMMCYKSGKAKEIEQHLKKISEISEQRFIDEKNSLMEIGSWGYAVYKIVMKQETIAFVLLDSKKVY